MSSRGSAARDVRTLRALAAVSFLVGGLSACDGHLIRLGAGPEIPDAAADGVPDGGPGDAVSPCPPAIVAASEVLWMGDSWINVPGGQLTGVRDLARASQAIGANDDYTVTAVGGATMSAIAGQYAMQEASATKPKVLVMDGGTIDTIAGQGSEASAAAAVTAFQQLLTKVAADGTVQQIVYFMVPELPAIYGVSALRPLMQQACAGSVVPCHFLDLQPSWAGHPEYTASNGILPTDAGARVMASLLWATMQASCIAQ